MPFPKCKIRHSMSFGSCAREVTVTDPETGVVSTVMQDCNKPLPDAEMTDIANMIKAGVTLDEVNTKILSSGLDTSELGEALKAFKSKTEKQNKEVNDEN